MEARATPIQRILDSNVQLIVPIFQREYSWEIEQIKTLWEDILKIYEYNYNIKAKDLEEISHFLGPIVRSEIPSSSVDIRRTYMIDGQQRIITIMVFLSAIRNRMRHLNDSIARKIDYMYLLNIEEENENRFKLRPSEADRDNFTKILMGKTNLTDSLLKECFDFINKELDTREELDLEKLRAIIVRNLILVNIDVGSNENPYFIFESLNAKGLLLTQPDLIRNYVFMKIPSESMQIELFRKYWNPMQMELGTEIDSFFWQYSRLEGELTKKERIYRNLKFELEPHDKASIEKKLQHIKQFTQYYSRIINPDKEEISEIRKRLKRYRQWDVKSSPHPFILNVYEDFNSGRISKEEFCRILDVIESFIVRRFLSKRPSNQLNKLLIPLYQKVDKDNFVASLQQVLLPDWPDDLEFIAGFKKQKIYRSGVNRTRLILESLENNFEHKEPIDYSSDNIQIEHVLPQAGRKVENLTPEWKEILGPDYRDIYNKYLHTIGNLTLTGYNSEASKKPFEDKKRIYEESHFEINKYFRDVTTWNQKEIEKRAEYLANIAVRIWRHPKGNMNLFLDYK